MAQAARRRALDGLSPKPRQPRRTPEQVDLEKLRRRNAQLEAELAKTRPALDITGKAHALLELLSESADTDKPSKRVIAAAFDEVKAVTSTKQA